MISILQILGGLALFLFGVRFMSDGMEKIAGHRLQEWLDRMTNRPIKAATFGMFATGLIRSSSMVMVTMIGLINANLMTLEQSIGVMMGQEIGTTLTAQIVAFNIGDFFFILILAGMIMREFLSARKWQRAGDVILASGLLFLGMQTMSGALKTLAATPVAHEFLAYMGQNYYSGVLAGAIVTGIIQSSSAMTGLAVAMGMSQIITLPGAIGLILGANIGTCITGMIASLRLSTAAKQASIAQILINVIGVLLFLPFIAPFAALVETTSINLARQIANAHTIFNVTVSVILFPFIKPLATLTRRLVPITKDTRKIKLTKYIDESQIRMPGIALAEATKELHRIGETTADMLNLSREAVIQGNSNASDRILKLEYELVNPLCARLEGFLSELMKEDLSQQQRRRCMHLIEMTTDVERVGDFTEDLVLLATNNHKQDHKLSEKEIGELDQFFKDAHKTYTTALVAVRDNSRETAMVVSSMEEKMDRQYVKARKKYVKRVDAGKVHPESENFYLEVLRNLERICDHADGISITVLRN